jgi:hypothetical protein
MSTRKSPPHSTVRVSRALFKFGEFEFAHPHRLCYDDDTLLTVTNPLPPEKKPDSNWEGLSSLWSSPHKLRLFNWFGEERERGFSWVWFSLLLWLPPFSSAEGEGLQNKCGKENEGVSVWRMKDFSSFFHSLTFPSHHLSSHPSVQESLSSLNLRAREIKTSFILFSWDVSTAGFPPLDLDVSSVILHIAHCT